MSHPCKEWSTLDRFQLYWRVVLLADGSLTAHWLFARRLTLLAWQAAKRPEARQAFQLPQKADALAALAVLHRQLVRHQLFPPLGAPQAWAQVLLLLEPVVTLTEDLLA